MTWKIYPSITTTSTQEGGTDWREKILEVKKLKLREICIFPTQLSPIDREELYSLLEEAQVESIPLVHMRHDETVAEVEYLMAKFKTKVFNIHPQMKDNFTMENDFSAFKEVVFMENNVNELDDEPANWGGICLDTSHMENARLIYPDLFKEWSRALEKYPVGGWHLNAIDPVAGPHPYKNEMYHDKHLYTNLKQLDYSTRYLKYIPEIVALELENSIEEQLVAAEYLTRMFRE